MDGIGFCVNWEILVTEAQMVWEGVGALGVCLVCFFSLLLVGCFLCFLLVDLLLLLCSMGFISTYLSCTFTCFFFALLVGCLVVCVWFYLPVYLFGWTSSYYERAVWCDNGGLWGEVGPPGFILVAVIAVAEMRK